MSTSGLCGLCHVCLHYLGPRTPKGRVILFCPNGCSIELVAEGEVTTIMLDATAEMVSPTFQALQRQFIEQEQAREAHGG